MAKTLQQILGAKNLTGLIQAVKGGLAEDIIPSPFMTPNRSVEGNHCIYRKVEGTRKTARLVQYGAPSVARNLSGISEVPITLAHSVEHISHDPSVLMNLTNMENESRQRLGQQEIARKTGEFKQTFSNLRVAVVMSMLTQGKVYFDVDGNLLPNSSNAVTTIDYGIPSGNRTTLNVGGWGTIISAKWSAAATNIHTQIQALRKAARKLTGYPIAYAFYGANVLDYIWSNTKLKEIINRQTPLKDGFAAGEIPDGFLRLKWRPIYEAFYQDQDGNYQDLADDDTVIFTPEPSVDWYEFIEGTYPIPNNVGAVVSDSSAALGNVSIETGMFSYATVTSDPVGIKQVAGDTFLPIIKVPNSVFIGTVHW